MSRPETVGRPETAKAILRYFLRNPQAADTLEGIVRWRLLEERVDRTLEEAQKALQWLISEGFVIEEAKESAGLSSPVYRLNTGRAADGERYLAGESGPGCRRED